MTVGGVLLAAGESNRYGTENKLLADLDGTPIVRHAAETLVAADLEPIVVVLGADATRVRGAIDELPVHVVENPAYANGQSTSVATGVAAIADHVDAFVIALGDMPWIKAETVATLVDAYVAGAGNALAAAYEGERGNPVLFDATYADDLQNLDGDVGGREILLEQGTLVETGDPAVRRDVDRPADLPE